MMMAELPLGLSWAWEYWNRLAADVHDDGRAPSWALHDLGKERRASCTPCKLKRIAADLHDDGRAPSRALHDLG